MPRLPPPPNVGRASASSEEEAARAAAAAELPSAVTDLPDEWLAEAGSAPPPVPQRAEPAFEIPTFDEAEAQPDPLSGISVAPPPEPPAAPPVETPPPVVDEPAVAIVEAKPVSAVPPPVATPTSAPRTTVAVPTDANRRMMLGAGAVLGAVLVVVMIIRCGSTDPQTTSPKSGVATARTFDGGKPTTSPSPTAASAGGAASGGDGGGGGGGGAGGGDGAAASGGANDANAGSDNAAAAASGGDAAANDAAADEDAKAEDAKAEDAKAEDAKAEDAKAEDAKAEDAKAEGDVVVAADEPTPASTSPKAASSSSSSSRTDHVAPSQPSPDANLTAAENLEKARAAWKAGNARDTYKYANKSRFKEPSDEATELATLAACKMKLDEAAKTSFKQLDGDRRKRTRNACRDFGVRVGL